MSTREDIGDRLIYSCNCGWLDLGHASPTSTRPHEGASALWRQMQDGKPAMVRLGRRGFRVIYRQFMGSAKFGGVGVVVHRSYLVDHGLTLEQKQSVALAIFMEVSMKFEAVQDSVPFSLLTDSGFSAEDLVSNLVSFYSALYPHIDFVSRCRPVSKQASLDIWDRDGSVGSMKNRSFRPIYLPCDECKGGHMPPETFFKLNLDRIKPATKGEHFVDIW